MHPLPANLSTMPDPCAGVPGNPWCSAPRKLACTDRRSFTFRLHHGRTPVVDVRVFVNGRLRVHHRGRNLKRVTLPRLPRKRFTVEVIATQRDGAQLVSQRTYSGCTKTRPRTRARHKR